MEEFIKVLWVIQKMESQFIFSGSSSDEEIDKNIENDSNIREGNERHYLYPQYYSRYYYKRKK
jgi:hypothetical protein